MGWEPPIPASIPALPEDAGLVAALWTSYRPVSHEFLSGIVLPQLLEIDRSENEEQKSHELFIAEAMQALEPLKGHLTVITSPPVSRSNSQDDVWLWQYVTTFMVGKEGPCIQHAKLWLFHWESKRSESEYLQITVSSTNLTADAFKHQIQGGWTITLPVDNNGRKPKKNHLDTLVNFLSELGTSAGSECSKRIDYWNSLISRTTPPANIKFIASIPGKPSPLTQWPIQKSSKLWILAPFIGQWDIDSLGAWKKAICKKGAVINLLWPHKSHEWVDKIDNEGQTNWLIPEKSLNALLKQGECLRRLPEPPVFNGGQENDQRWGHLKLYGLDEGLLVGSHNWSLSAWGLPTNNVNPKNFELSVFIPNARIPCNLRLRELSKQDVCSCQAELLKPEGHWLSWAQAQWDGQWLHIEWKATKYVNIAWYDGIEWRLVKVKSEANEVSVPISDIEKAPRCVKFAIGDSVDDEVSIPVADIRPGDDLPPVGLPPSITEKADRILLEKYGGPQAETNPSPKPPLPPNKNKGEGEESADYRPQWLISSRRWSKVVDKWRDKFKGNEDGRGSSDARRLAAALERLSTSEGIGASIAAKELQKLAETKK